MVSRKRLFRGMLLSTFFSAVTLSPATAQVPDPPVAFEGPDGMRRIDPRIAEFASISRGAKVQEGLFKTYHKDENVYIELLPHHFNKQLLCPIAIAKGAAMAGTTLNSDEQWVLLFKKVGDKVHLIRRDVHHKARSGSPLAKALDNSYTDSVLMSLRTVGLNQQTQGVLINLNDIFMSDFGELGAGRFDASRSVWHKIKVFPKNIELQIQATYVGGRGDDSVIDPRGKTIFVHYGLCEMPDSGYTPRIADDRVGYFVTAQKDFSSNSKDTSFVRYINRWRLEPAEPMEAGKLSVPKRSIKFYIEKTVPHEYRAAVQEGILEWNKAFEKIGYRNAIEVVQQRDDEDFDPEDMNYNTFRWVTNDQGFAIGPSRANPFTGEILDADILFDSDFIRMWKQERQIYRFNGMEIEPASPIQAMDLGWGLNHSLLQRNTGPIGLDIATQDVQHQLARLNAIRHGVCQCRNHTRMELGMANLSLLYAVQDPKKPKDKDAKDKDAKDPAKEKADKELNELINQAIKSIVMHEVGHTLGLRHNFKGSTMLPNDQLHDTKITREKGLIGSVMDYAPVNIAPKGVKQGDYFTTTLGPYDYWAVEYGYKPITGDEAAELKKIASKGPATPGLDYGTDEDVVLTADPITNRWDLGQDVLKFSQDRMAVAEELIKSMATRIVDSGEGYQRNRIAFNMLLSQYGNGAYLVSRYVGGEHAYRDHRDDPKGHDPLVPVAAAKQREAMKFLQEKVFDDKTFQFPPELLRKFGVERWMHWGTDPVSTDFPLYDRVLSIQKMAMNQLLSPKVLQRVQMNALKADKGEKPVTIAEVFRCVTDGVWSDMLKNGDKKDVVYTSFRRNLQREHIKKLGNMVLGERIGIGGGLAALLELLSGGGGTVPPDAQSLARHHLRELNKMIDNSLKAMPTGSDEIQIAHLEECKEKIAKLLAASLQSHD
ncbi:MAG: zinc-dependent metalloprotease [Gemmatales bacterium]